MKDKTEYIYGTSRDFEKFKEKNMKDIVSMYSIEDIEKRGGNHSYKAIAPNKTHLFVIDGQIFEFFNGELNFLNEYHDCKFYTGEDVYAVKFVEFETGLELMFLVHEALNTIGDFRICNENACKFVLLVTP